MPVEEIKNGIKYVEKPLSDQMREWKEQGENVGILLVDESNAKEADETIMTLDQYHRYQRRILEVGMELAYPIFITEMLLTRGLTEDESFRNLRDNMTEKLVEAQISYGFPVALREVIPPETCVYKKDVDDTRSERNHFLKDDLNSNGIKKLIVMGQSRRACCGGTSNYLCEQIRDLEIHTSPYIVRFGSLIDAPKDEVQWKEYFPSFPDINTYWPMGRTTVFKSI